MTGFHEARRTFAALRQDMRGNVLMLTSLGMFVLIGMGGGGLDLARLFLAKNRLQQACDAGALAYRRAMQGTNVVPETYPTALSYFTANYPAGRYGTSNTLFPEPVVDSNVVVHGTATTTVPMTLMKLLGSQQRVLTVTCDAQLQLPNTDVMFVLDTTGSMTDTNPGDSSNKITALRQAVLNFYTTLENAKIGGTQVRYGFVPYSNTVNVGTLLHPDWLADAVTYQSRAFDQQTQEQTGTEPDTISDNTPWSPAATYTQTQYPGDPENCAAPANTAKTTSSSATAWSPSSTALPRSRTAYQTYGGDTYSASLDSSGRCIITKTSYPTVNQQRTETVKENPKAKQPIYSTRNYWWYKPVTFDVSGYKAANGGAVTGGSVTFYVDSPSGSQTAPAGKAYAWNASTACIEERKTLRPGETGTAWDMDVDTIPDPSRPDTQWRPFLPWLIYARSVGSYSGTPSGWSVPAVRTSLGYVRLSSQSSVFNACPSAARKLQSKEAGLTYTALQTYLNGLATRGRTYHDIGFLWGLRLISKEGLFSAENSSAPNGNTIGRNIIFMTDGDTETRIQDYDAYGLSALDRRRTDPASLPTDSAQNAIVEDRLTRYCTIAKTQKGMTVWVIAFGTSLTSLLQNCASQGRAFQANNTDELNRTFAEIASKIAQLRLTR